jgi:transposase
MNKPTSLEERVRIGIMAELGLSDKEIAQRIGWSVHTVRKWRRQYEREGRSGLASPMGRPKQGALSTFPVQLRERLRTWREAHPGWGAKTLHAELQVRERSERQPLPSIASIGRFWHEQGVVRPYEKHQNLPVAARDPAQQPHAAWEMDARGYGRIPDVGLVSLIQLNDRCSHVRLLSYPVWVGEQRCIRHPTTEDYQTALRLAFTDWGLPEQLQVDHEAMFFDNKSKSPFPTRLHL